MAFKKLKLWFDKDLAILLAHKIIKVQPSFNKNRFVRTVTKRVEAFELKGRVEEIADILYFELEGDYQHGIDILLQILGPENKKETGMFTEYYWVMPIAKYVEKYGLDDFKLSMKAIEEITKRNTGEYTIRPFITHYKTKTMKQMLKWSKSKNKHVRRLASEGVRPRLPWASKLEMFIRDPQPILPILENLKDDPSKYVQKSVANCINDILKDNLITGKELIDHWNIAVIGKDRKWIIKHALRNMSKAGDEWAEGVVSE